MVFYFAVTAVTALTVGVGGAAAGSDGGLLVSKREAARPRVMFGVVKIVWANCLCVVFVVSC